MKLVAECQDKMIYLIWDSRIRPLQKRIENEVKNSRVIVRSGHSFTGLQDFTEAYVLHNPRAIYIYAGICSVTYRDAEGSFQLRCLNSSITVDIINENVNYLAKRLETKYINGKVIILQWVNKWSDRKYFNQDS